MISVYLRENELETAKLSFQGKRIDKISHLIPQVVDITGRIGPDRLRTENFMKQVFGNTYGANIQVHYPQLISVSDHEGNMLAAAGFRYAQEEPLFLEQYTQQTIEQKLTHLYQQPIERRDIVEIGSLASAGGGAAIFLFAALASYLKFKQVRYTVVTGTSDLYRHLKSLGLQPQKLCQAQQTHLQPCNDEWGSYYANQPWVLAGSIEEGVKSLQRTLGSVYEQPLPPFRYYWGQLS